MSKKNILFKKNEKTRFSFQSGPNLMSFAFKRGVGLTKGEGGIGAHQSDLMRCDTLRGHSVLKDTMYLI